jgi:hypothetical protein
MGDSPGLENLGFNIDRSSNSVARVHQTSGVKWTQSGGPLRWVSLGRSDLLARPIHAGGAIASSARPLVSRPIISTATAPTNSSAAMNTNTAGVPKAWMKTTV